VELVKRIVAAVGAVTAVVVLGLGATSVLGETGEPAPQAPPEVSRPLDRDEPTDEAQEQARQAALDDLTAKVDEATDRLQQDR
jgi:hypothetical protein